MKTSIWRRVAYHAFTVFLEPWLLPVGIPVFLIHRAKEKKENRKFQELVIRLEPNLPQDLYYKASVALVNALAYGKYERLDAFLADDVQVIQNGHKTIKGKTAAMRFWERWKSKHVDAIDLDAFDRIFDDTDFEVVKCDDDSHACAKLMMTHTLVNNENSSHFFKDVRDKAFIDGLYPHFIVDFFVHRTHFIADFWRRYTRFLIFGFVMKFLDASGI